MPNSRHIECVQQDVFLLIPQTIFSILERSPVLSALCHDGVPNNT